MRYGPGSHPHCVCSNSRWSGYETDLDPGWTSALARRPGLIQVLPIAGHCPSPGLSNPNSHTSYHLENVLFDSHVL